MNAPATASLALAAVLAAAGVCAAAGGGRHGGRGSGNNQGQNSNGGPNASGPNGDQNGNGNQGPDNNNSGNQNGNNSQNGANGFPGTPVGPGAPVSAPVPSVSTQPVVYEPREPDRPPRKLTLSDVRLDFQTVVQTYLAQNGVDGVWPYEGDDRVWKLSFVKFNVKSIKKKSRDLYSGLVAMREGDKLRVFEFVVDFSGAEWEVVSAEPAKSKSPKTAAPRRK